MRTSRIARETAKVTKLLSPSRKRQTRSSLASYSASAKLPASPETENGLENRDDTSSISSALSDYSIDDSQVQLRSSKRKRGEDKPGTQPSTRAVTTVSVKTRKSPRKKTTKVEENVDIEEAGIPRPKKARRQPSKQQVDPSTGDVVIHPPPNWEEVYTTTQEMRKLVLAPVDTMGCERAGDQARSPKDGRFQTLVALMLSSQTKDTTNALTMERLRTELPPPGLTLSNILDVEPSRLNELIYACGFHNNKTRYIKAAAEILRDKFDGDIPDTIEGLTSLPGVGPKMAYLCMSSAWGRTLGIGVDVHVHRITNLWGWHKTKTPEETRAALEAWLPKEKWHEINHLLVGFGQTICTPVGRDCSTCALSEKGLCPSAVVGKGKKVKRVKKEEGLVNDNGRVVKKEIDREIVKEEEVLAEDITSTASAS